MFDGERAISFRRNSTNQQYKKPFMSIKAYTGTMGSGKTYEVVSEVVLGALRRGRRVVSNIAGLDFEAMRVLLLAEGVPEGAIGEIVSVPHEQVLEPLFWRTDSDADKNVDAFIQPGDVVVLDEIWRFWDGFKPRSDDGDKVVKRPDRVMNFFRMHRQFPCPETGMTCEIALITQDVVNDLHRSVKGVVEETYLMEKLVEIGSDSRYRVMIFPKVRVSRRPSVVLQRTYNPAIFPLYKSHSQKKDGDAAPREVSIDKRGNILRGALFKFVLPVGLVVMVMAVYTVVSFFNPKPKVSVQTADAKTVTGQAAPLSHAKGSVEVSDEWRAAGYLTGSGGVVVLLVSGGRLRYVNNPPSFRVSGSEIETFLPSGEAVASWSGKGAASVLPGTK